MAAGAFPKSPQQQEQGMPPPGRMRAAGAEEREHRPGMPTMIIIMHSRPLRQRYERRAFVATPID